MSALAETPATGGVAQHSLLLVANVNASGVGGRRDVVENAESALRGAGARVELALTENAEALAAALDGADGRRVVLLGGDGSMHLVANLGRRPEVALLPAGRANNVATSLGIPRDLPAAAALAVHGRARPLDAIEASSLKRRYVAVEGVSVGFLAQARARYSAPNSAAIGAGILAGMKALREFRPFDVVLVNEGMTEELRIGQLFAANLPRYAFGLRVAPDADARDGLLDVVALTPRSRAGLLALGPRLRRGTHVRSPLTRTWRASRLRVDPRGASPVIADSVDLGTGPVELAVRPAALQVVAP